MAPAPKYPPSEVELLRLLVECRRRGMGFEDAWSVVVRPGRAMVLMNMVDPPELALRWPSDRFARLDVQEAIHATKAGWQRAYDRVPPLPRESAVGSLAQVWDLLGHGNGSNGNGSNGNGHPEPRRKPKKAKPSLTADERQQIIDAYRAGEATEDLARRFGRAASTVQKCVRGARDDRLEELTRLAGEGLTSGAIAARMRLPTQWVEYVRRQVA